MKKHTLLLYLLIFGLLSQTSSGVVSFAGYDWYDGSSMSELSDGNLVANVGTSSSTWTVYFAPETNPITLAEPGDKLVITLKFILTGVNVSNTSQNFRIGVMDSPADTRVTGDNSPGEGDYTGYALFGNMGQITDNSGSFQIRERTAPGKNLSTSSLWTSQDTGMGRGVLGYEDGIEYTFTASVERTDNGSAQVDFMMTGGSVNDTGTVSVSFLDGTPQPFTYDTLMIRPSNAATTADTFTFTEFTVTGPEGSGPAKGPGYLGNYDIVTVDGGMQWVDTGNWMGWLAVDAYPFVYISNLTGWIYFPDPDSTGDKDAPGSWAWIYR
jgi:hypothetical protein